MRVRAFAYSLLLALTACGSSSAATDASTTSARAPAPHVAACGPSADHTVAASARARVYSAEGNVYGCAVGSHHSYLLGASMHTIREGRAGPIAVAGRYAAYALTSFGVDTVSSLVIVRNLETGHKLRELAATTKVLPESFQTVDGIVVKSDGAVAWISGVTSVFAHGSAGLEVQRADSRGPAVLASSSSIDPDSLHLSGSTLTWRDGSRTRTATLR